MQRDPTTGVKGVKPRFKPAKEEMPELSKEYLQIRKEHQRTKMLAAQMELAAGYLLTVLRQRALALPAAVCDQLAAIRM